MTRPIPTVRVSPALLERGDMIHPDLEHIPDDADPFRVEDITHDELGWLIFLDGGSLFYLPFDRKVRTQRRPMPQPLWNADAADEIVNSYPEPSYG